MLLIIGKSKNTKNKVNYIICYLKIINYELKSRNLLVISNFSVEKIMHIFCDLINICCLYLQCIYIFKKLRKYDFIKRRAQYCVLRMSKQN